MAEKTGTAVSERKPPPVIAMLDSRMRDFAAVLPKHMHSDRFVRTIKTAINLNPQLLECQPSDLFNECQKAAADGLVLDGREATLTIYNTKRKVKTAEGFVEKWIKTPKYIPMYMGLIKRARNSGELKTISAFIIGENEAKNPRPAPGKPGFRRWVDSDGEHIEYEPMVAGDPGPPAGGFSVARLGGGIIDFCWMPITDIRRIQQRTKSRRKVKGKGGEDAFEITGPWATDEIEMMKKTIIRRHSKTLPMDSDLARVFSRDDDLYDPEGGAIDVTPATPNKTAGVGAARLNDDLPEHDGPEIEAEAAPQPPKAAKQKPDVHPKRQAAEPEEPPPNDGEYEGDPI